MSLPYHYILRPNQIIIVPIDGLTPQAARPSAQCCIHRQVVLRLDPNSLIWQHNWKWPTRYPVSHEHISVIDTLNAPVITVITLLNQISLIFLHPWLFLICQIVLKFWTEHGNIIVVLLAKFQNDLTNTPAMIIARVWFEITMLINV